MYRAAGRIETAPEDRAAGWRCRNIDKSTWCEGDGWRGLCGSMRPLSDKWDSIPSPHPSQFLTIKLPSISNLIVDESQPLVQTFATSFHKKRFWTQELQLLSADNHVSTKSYSHTKTQTCPKLLVVYLCQLQRLKLKQSREGLTKSKLYKMA